MITTRSTRAAYSLLEIMIVIALLGSVVIGVGVLIGKGVDFYLDSTDGVEVRKELMFGAARLSRDIADSHIDTVQVEPDGIVMASIRNAGGEAPVDDRGRTLWQKYVCYYLDNSTTPPRLMRKEADLPRDPTKIPHPLNPPAGEGERNPPDPLAETPPRDVSWFRSNTAIPGRIAARNVISFTTVKKTDLVEFSLEVSTSSRRQHLISMNTQVKPKQ